MAPIDGSSATIQKIRFGGSKNTTVDAGDRRTSTMLLAKTRRYLWKGVRCPSFKLVAVLTAEPQGPLLITCATPSR